MFGFPPVCSRLRGGDAPPKLGGKQKRRGTWSARRRSRAMSLLKLRLNLEPDSSLLTVAAKSSRFFGVLAHLEFRPAAGPAAAARVGRPCHRERQSCYRDDNTRQPAVSRPGAPAEPACPTSHVRDSGGGE